MLAVPSLRIFELAQAATPQISRAMKCDARSPLTQWIFLHWGSAGLPIWQRSAARLVGARSDEASIPHGDREATFIPLRGARLG